MGTRFALAVALAGIVATVVGAQAGAALKQAQPTDYLVLYAEGASTASARLAVQAAGGTIVKENTAIGVATVRSQNVGFLSAVLRQPALAGAARNVPIGQGAPLLRPKDRNDETGEQAVSQGNGGGGNQHGEHTRTGDPLAGLQWNMAMIHATVDGSYQNQRGDRRVLVGILDTGIDASHPDIAPNVNAALSRNFTTDIPLIDGPCEDEPDHSCSDPANVDEDGHGTHVAGIVAGALNGIGVADVAPTVTLVNLRAGPDSGFFFLQATVDALTFAADNGIDVVNMSYYIDPWLYNCASNPADSPDAQLEQRTIVEATNRALDYASKRGVTLIGAAGNSHEDPAIPRSTTRAPTIRPARRTPALSTTRASTCRRRATTSSASTPWGRARRRPTTRPTASSSPSSRRRAAGSATTSGRRSSVRLRTEVLSAYPESLAIANGDLNPDATPNTPFVVRDCQHGVCGYYQYAQGTSMASPHAVGVAALIVSEFGPA